MARGPEDEFEQAIDGLYALPLEDFTAARNALAKEAREAGERALAARIKELRKPGVSAWAVNRLARDRELDVQRLLKAGERLRAAQRDVVAGRDAGDFLAARRDEQQALGGLARAARELLEREGHGLGAVDRIVRTLRAAATSDEGRELLKRGRLTEDLEPQGFDALAGVPPARSKERKQRTGAAARKREIVEARGRLRELQRQERALARDAEAAQREAAQAEKRARELADAAEDAQTAAREAADAVASSERALAELTADDA